MIKQGASSKKSNNSRILVVDDEKDVLEFLSIFLSSLGWRVTTASSVEAAFKALAARTYFLVLTDIAMPEMDGYEFIHSIREAKITTEVALMTGFGYNPRHTLIKINRSMHCPIFFKPFDRGKVADGVAVAWKAYHREFLSSSSS